jgi:hypothetical protein
MLYIFCSGRTLINSYDFCGTKKMFLILSFILIILVLCQCCCYLCFCSNWGQWTSPHGCRQWEVQGCKLRISIAHYCVLCRIKTRKYCAYGCSRVEDERGHERRHLPWVRWWHSWPMGKCLGNDSTVWERCPSWREWRTACSAEKSDFLLVARLQITMMWKVSCQRILRSSNSTAMLPVGDVYTVIASLHAHTSVLKNLGLFEPIFSAA